MKRKIKFNKTILLCFSYFFAGLSIGGGLGFLIIYSNYLDNLQKYKNIYTTVKGQQVELCLNTLNTTEQLVSKHIEIENATTVCLMNWDDCGLNSKKYFRNLKEERQKLEEILRQQKAELNKY